MIASLSTYLIFIWCFPYLLHLTSGREQKVAEVSEVSGTFKDACETMPSTIQVTKEEYDELGNVVRACEGTIAVTKCEGTCTSQIQPSVVTPTGFLKDCHCCRETWMRQREILLTDCYTQDGKRIFGQQGTMVIHLKEPEACSCHKCGL
ncbi:partner of bursicon-like [Stegodyphus dumicola]|uniref:partner of bursicon-like n=1 Tax=Stegodyphus dumicola TaxID=202533 RepID=UPI0015ADB252|nr:partner of bursicon-like [Stegodyphus dumicola]